jgi:hypothetical protein
MRLQKKTVWEQVKIWAVIYPSAQKRTQAEEAAIATEFFFSLEDDLSDEEFSEASRMVKKLSRFFPTIAQIFELKDRAIETLARKRSLIALPAPEESEQTLEDMVINIESLQAIKDLLSGKLTMDQAQDRVEFLRRERIETCGG